MAIVDYDYKFLYVDVGCQGRISDGGVFRNTSFYDDIENDMLKLPEPTQLPRNDGWAWEQDESLLPFVFVGDDAFSLTSYCMKPFPQRNLTDKKRIFNYRLSRFRRVTENAFGICSP